MNTDRREFLLRLARGAVYSTPVIRSFAMPEGLLGQDSSEISQKGGMGMDMDETVMGASAPLSTESAPSAPARPAPWEVPPPGEGGGGG